MRRTAKAVNFGILYGISSFGLSEDLGIDIATAKKFITNYLETYPGISEYMDKEKREGERLEFYVEVFQDHFFCFGVPEAVVGFAACVQFEEERVCFA